MRKDVIENAIMGLKRSSRGIQGCAVVSSDGHMMASSLKPGTDLDRVGAMSAAVQKLGKEAARELGCGALEQITLKGESGYVLLLGVGGDAVLSVITDASAKLGLILQDARGAVLRITESG